jgi:hypothetical protein
VQVLVEGREEMTIAAIRVTDGIDCCHIRFLPPHRVAQAAKFDVALAKFTRIYSGDAAHSDTAEPHMFHRNKGCCLAAINSFIPMADKSKSAVDNTNIDRNEEEMNKAKRSRTQADVNAKNKINNYG